MPKSAGVLRAAIDKVRPDIVLCVGQAGGRSELCLERVGINVQDARIRDNDGKQPIDKPVVKDGPAAYFATPADQGLRGGDAQGRPAGGRVEHGRHLRLQPHPLFADGHRPGPSRCLPRRLPAHPYVPEQVARLGAAPSMAVDDIVRGIEIILEVSAERTVDIQHGRGRIS